MQMPLGVIFVVLGMGRLLFKKASVVGSLLDEGCWQPTGAHWLGVLLPSRNMSPSVL